MLPQAVLETSLKLGYRHNTTRVERIVECSSRCSKFAIALCARPGVAWGYGKRKGGISALALPWPGVIQFRRGNPRGGLLR